MRSAHFAARGVLGILHQELGTDFEPGIDWEDPLRQWKKLFFFAGEALQQILAIPIHSPANSDDLPLAEVGCGAQRFS